MSGREFPHGWWILPALFLSVLFWAGIILWMWW